MVYTVYGCVNMTLSVSGLESSKTDMNIFSIILIFLLWSAAERPIKFLQELKNIQVQEGNGVTLCCELSKPGIPVQWKKGDKVLTNGEKYQIKQSGSTLELLIRKSQPEDSGTYRCVCEDLKTTSTVIITGENHYTICNTIVLWQFAHLVQYFAFTFQRSR